MGVLNRSVHDTVTTASVVWVSPTAHNLVTATVMPVRFGAAAVVLAVTVPHVDVPAHNAATLAPSRAACERVTCALNARPKSMIPKTNTMRIGSISANSTATAPRSALRRTAELFAIITAPS
jgi:hypothetical protein